MNYDKVARHLPMIKREILVDINEHMLWASMLHATGGDWRMPLIRLKNKYQMGMAGRLSKALAKFNHIEIEALAASLAGETE